MFEDFIEVVEGDKDIEKVVILMDKIGFIMEDIIEFIKEFFKELYNFEKMVVMGKSVVDFYKNFVEVGMDKEVVFELMKEYMVSINVVKILIEIFVNMMVSKGGNVSVNIFFGYKKVREIEIEEEEEKEE